jgi:hypothetical protein
MSGWLDLTLLGLAPNQKHQALLGAPMIVQCGEALAEKNRTSFVSTEYSGTGRSKERLMGCLFALLFSEGV